MRTEAWLNHNFPFSLTTSHPQVCRTCFIGAIVLRRKHQHVWSTSLPSLPGPGPSKISPPKRLDIDKNLFDMNALVKLITKWCRTSGCEHRMVHDCSRCLRWKPKKDICSTYVPGHICPTHVGHDEGIRDTCLFYRIDFSHQAI